MKHDNSYYLEYSDYCLHLHKYTHNVSADMSFGFLKVSDVGEAQWIK